LRHAAGDLALDQHRVDRFANVISNEIALYSDAAGAAIDAYHREMNSVGIVHMS
jgi:hypothetical protein